VPVTALRRRHGWLVLIAGLHLALFAGWRFTARPPLPATVRHEGELVFLTPAQARQARKEAPPPTLPAPPFPRGAVRAPAPIAVPPPAPPVVEQPAPAAPDPFAPPAVVAESVLERSRRAAIGVDRLLRKESKNDNDRVLAHESKLAQDIALAYKGSGSFSMAETLLPNGDTLARVTTPLGSYCLLKRGNRGLNAIENAGRTLIVTCPK
jgi:hypothetical protein